MKDKDLLSESRNVGKKFIKLVKTDSVEFCFKHCDTKFYILESVNINSYVLQNVVKST